MREDDSAFFKTLISKTDNPIGFGKADRVTGVAAVAHVCAYLLRKELLRPICLRK